MNEILTGAIPSDLCYLATPYSKYVGGIECAFVDASKLAARLLRAGIKVYSPIAHTHPLALYGNIDPLDHAIWMPFDEAMMTVAQTLIVAHMDGWQDSFGISHEVKFFEAAGKPIFDLDPVTFTMSRRETLATALGKGARKGEGAARSPLPNQRG